MTRPVKTDAMTDAAPLRLDEVVVKEPRTSEEFTRDLRGAIVRLMTDPNDHESVEVLVKICVLNCKIKSGKNKGKKLFHARRAVGKASPQPPKDAKETEKEVDDRRKRSVPTDDPIREFAEMFVLERRAEWLKDPHETLRKVEAGGFDWLGYECHNAAIKEGLRLAGVTYGDEAKPWVEYDDEVNLHPGYGATVIPTMKQIEENPEYFKGEDYDKRMAREFGEFGPGKPGRSSKHWDTWEPRSGDVYPLDDDPQGQD